MARSLKTRGIAELASLRARVRRQLALERITSRDAEHLLSHIILMEAHIVHMREINEQGEEEG